MYRTITSTAPQASDLEENQLDVTDVLAARVVETGHLGRVTIRPDSAAGALEVMSRFALHAGWLPHLPPTMAPVARSSHPELLEHPAEAFAAFAASGVGRVTGEERHMGSMAVALICRNPEVARTRFGATDVATGVVYTHTGRSFFSRKPTQQLLGRLRGACAVRDDMRRTWCSSDPGL